MADVAKNDHCLRNIRIDTTKQSGSLRVLSCYSLPAYKNRFVDTLECRSYANAPNEGHMRIWIYDTVYHQRPIMSVYL